MPASLVDLADLVDFTLLPADSLLVAQGVADGWTHEEIAREVGHGCNWVAARVKEIRAEIVRQAREQASELPADLRARLADFDY